MKNLSTIFNELNELEKDLSCYNLHAIQNNFYKYYTKNKPRWEKLKDLLAMNYVFADGFLEEKLKELLGDEKQ